MALIASGEHGHRWGAGKALSEVYASDFIDLLLDSPDVRLGKHSARLRMGSS